ncbi:MAG: serine/threonine-protein kinase [Polyangiales bacterium]
MADRAPIAQVGEVFAGRYRLEERLGAGGMAQVYAAMDLATRGSVAVKILRSEIAHNEEVQERFRREGEILQRLRHPSIVVVDTFGQTEDGRTFIVMERLFGRTLADAVSADGPLPPDVLSFVVEQMADALSVAHGAGIIHRDLKPQNVFVSQGVGSIAVKILDFGISKMNGTERITVTGELLGTPRYMAPEQLEGRGTIDHRVDVYSTGVLLYEALAGVSPFRARTAGELVVAVLQGVRVPLRERRPDLGADLATVVETAMAHDAGARFSSMQALAKAWRYAVEREPTAIDVGQNAATRLLGSVEPEGERAGVDDGRPLVPGTFAALPAMVDRPATMADGEVGIPAGLSAPSARRSAPLLLAVAILVAVGSAAAVIWLLDRFL